MSTKSAVRNENFKRMLKAMRRSWIPVNPELLERLRAGFEDGRYESDLELLIAELKTDLSLFSYCVRELSETINSGAAAEKITVHPFTLLREAGADRLRAILTQSHDDLYARRFNRMKRYQLSRMQESLTSSSVAEALAVESGVDPELAYSTALLRQLGLALIAWNYPRLYTRAVAALRRDASIDRILNKVLGFSPLLLGVALAKQWNLLPEIRVALGDKTGIEGPERIELLAKGERLSKLCTIGEALARANSPQEYPTAERDWSFAKAEIEKRLGEEGFALLERQIRETCRLCIEALPSVLRNEGEGRLSQKVRSSRGEDLFEQNTAIAACPPKVQAQLRGLYYRILPEEIDKDLIRLLAGRIIPAAGFLRGCVYTFDPGESALVPRLGVGEVKPQSFSSAVYRSDKTSENAIERAFHSDEPVRCRRLGEQGQGDSVAIAYGDINRAGVLLLELTSEMQADYVRALGMVRAFKQTLMDLLKLA